MTHRELPAFCNSVTTSRFFTYSTFLNTFKQFLNKFDSKKYQFDPIGKSVNGDAIFKLTLGSGKTKVLMWSQMHGNESTTTRSLFFMIDWFINSDISKDLSLYIIPVLNPDGLNLWIRENANGVDLNRDAQELSQPESRILRNSFDDFQPHYCFNLHDQRTIYGNVEGSRAVQCSFLAPSADEDRSITTARLKAMNVINSIVHSIKEDVTGDIGRYNDDFNINCVGDTFQNLGTPTILFEAGQATVDYMRNNTVEVMSKALQVALTCVKQGESYDSKDVITIYNEISGIRQNYCDIWLKNITTKNGVVDLSVMYKEVVQDQVLYFVPFLTGINDLSVQNAHEIIDCKYRDVEQLEIHMDYDQKFTSNLLGINSFY